MSWMGSQERANITVTENTDRRVGTLLSLKIQPAGENSTGTENKDNSSVNITVTELQKEEIW